MEKTGPPKICLKILLAFCLIIHAVHSQYNNNKQLTPCELESLLHEITDPRNGNELHAASLRNQLRRLLDQNEFGGGGGGGDTDDVDDFDEQQQQQQQEYQPNVELYEKRTLSSLARNGLIPGKRNIGSMARLGMLRANGGSGYGGGGGGFGETDIKRSIATLAKNGQLPSKEPETDDSTSENISWLNEKRNIGALARSGLLSGGSSGGGGKRNIAALARGYELPTSSSSSSASSGFYNGKRNLASIVRSSARPMNYNLKRNMAALARGNMLPLFGENEFKRNVGALARDWSLPTPTVNKIVDSKRQDDGNSINNQYEKRSIGALKNSPVHGTKSKREILYDDYATNLGGNGVGGGYGNNAELIESTYQQSPAVDYDEINEMMNQLYSPSSSLYDNNNNLHEDKRYLGSIIRDGWSSNSGYYKPLANIKKRNIGSLARLGLLRTDYNSYGQQKYQNSRQDKRHIGALARSGWLPASFSPARGNRFSRSGRARSQIVEYYPQPRRLRQPTAAACEFCSINWKNSAWGYQQQQSPNRMAALHRRSLRGPFHPTGDYF